MHPDQLIEAEFMPQTPQTALAQRPPTGLDMTVSAALEAQVRASIEARYALAIRQPRDLDLVRQRVLKECRRPGFAEVARWSRPIGGKTISGPTIRFAEMAIRNMTNISTQSMVVYEDQIRRILRMTVTDVESNVSAEADITVNKTVERSSNKDRDVLGIRQNKDGKAVYIVSCTEDELLAKQNAMLSRARRVLGLSLIPGDIVDEAQHVIRETQAKQDKVDPDAQRKKVFDGFADLGITPPEIKDYLGREAGTVDLPELRGLYQAIKQGDVNWREILEDKRSGEEGEASKGLADRLKAKAEAELLKNFKDQLGATTDRAGIEEVRDNAKRALSEAAFAAFSKAYIVTSDAERRQAQKSEA